MADQDIESRLAALEARVAKLGNGGSAFRPITQTTAQNPLFFRLGSLDHRNLRDRTRSIFIPVFSGTARTGSPAVTVSGANTRYRAWALDAASTEEVLFEWFLPTGFVIRSSPSSTIYLWYVNLGAGAGNIRWQITALPVYVSGGTTDLNNTAAETVITETHGAAAQDVLVRRNLATTLTLPEVFNTNGLIRLGVARIGGDAADTLANDVGLMGVEITYIADM